MEFAYSLSMYAAPDSYRRGQGSGIRRTAPPASSTATTNTTSAPTSTTTSPNITATTFTSLTPTHTDSHGLRRHDSYDDQDDHDNEEDENNNNHNIDTGDHRSSHRDIGNPDKYRDHSLSAAKRFRRPGRRRAASATPDTAPFHTPLALRPSRHTRTSSSGASSRNSHEFPTQRSFLHPFRSNTSTTTATDDSTDVAPAPVAAVTFASTAPASASTSATAVASDPPPTSPKYPNPFRAATHIFNKHSDPTAVASSRLHRETFYRRSSHILQPTPVATPPTFSLAGTGPSSPRPLRPTAQQSRVQHDAMPGPPALSKYSSVYPRNDSISSVSASTQAAMMANNDQFPSPDASGAASNTSASTGPKPHSVGPKAFVTRFNRTYIHDPTLAYPLPVDLTELHRQSLRTLLTFQLFGGPIISQAFANKPPSRILEVGCGSAFWSMMCHRYFAQHGHSSISFTGIDIVPLNSSGLDANTKPDKDMRWRFVQHDIRKYPWPFADGEFDLIMVKDMSMATSFRESQPLFEEYVRCLKPGGVLELWETDSTVRMLRPHVLKTAAPPPKSRDDDSSDSSSEEDERDNAERLGAYVMTTNTPLSAPLNQFLVEYNGWATKALDQRGLSAVPCTMIGPYLLQESEILTDVRSKRLAVPLSEIRWEREGVGGVVTKDGKSYIDMKGKTKAADGKGGKSGGKPLSTGQAALRRTALETTVGLILSFEPLIREISGKSQDEWDAWAGKMVNDLLREGGTSWGECLEIGAWTARKRQVKTS
ncbi:hypothetical protein F5Y15DRAFT_336296 [Xylariaceae sp. FL0016]|nr:hypothetical protein F5Y15DRAFT_336296 [Xylariaceae sp. FL0016]